MSQTSSTETAWKARSPVIRLIGPRLWTYLNSAATPSEVESVLLGLTQLPTNDFERLVDQRLASHHTVEAFIDEIAPSILRAIAKALESEPNTGWGRVRGRIDWPLTLAARRESGGYPGRYVWRAAERIYDLPENRLFKFALTNVRALARHAASGTAPGTAGIGMWRESAARLAVRAETLLGHVVLRNVSDVPTVDIRCWQRCWMHRRGDYRATATFLTWLLAAQRRSSLDNWHLLASTYLVPLSNDSLFELFVLMKVLQAAESQAWTVTEVRAIGGVSGPVFRLSRQGAKCDVFYQCTPVSLKERSQYIEMFRGTGISTSVRRPDIIIRIVGPRGRWQGLVEVKRTSARGYISDGIYKVLGYLRDFAEIDHQNGPKAVLVAWSGINPTPAAQPEVTILTANSLAKGLEPFLEDGLQSVS